jgi:predicted nucleotidyltransferase
MNFDVEARTIYMARHGSHAYGLNTPDSDEDFKGICVKPKEAYFGFTQRFEQHEHIR